MTLTQNMSYLYRVRDGEESSSVVLEVEVDYEEVDINNKLETNTTISVPLPPGKVAVARC